MLVKVRTGYGYTRGNDNYAPGAVLELTDEEYQKRRQIFEVIPKKEEVKVEDTPEELTLENRAILDSKAGAPLIRKGGRSRK